MNRREFILKASVPFLVAACSKDEDEKLLPKDVTEKDLDEPEPPTNAKFVCHGATLQCNMGMAPSSFCIIDPMREKQSDGTILANIMDNVPMLNFMPFGMCQSLSNPMVKAATAAAMGVLTPQPCTPIIAAPWSPGGQQMVGKYPALLDNAKLTCSWGGQISISYPGGHIEES